MNRTSKVDSQSECAAKLQEAIQALVAVLTSRDGLIRQSVRRSLVAIGEPAIPSLVGATKDKSRVVRWEAAKALGEMQCPACAPALVAALEDEDFGVRWLAAEALITLGPEGMQPLLLALIEDPESKWLRDGAHHVLRALMESELRKPVEPVVEALDSVWGATEIVPRVRAALEALAESLAARGPRAD